MGSEAKAIAKKYDMPCAAGEKNDTLHTVGLDLPSREGNWLSRLARRLFWRCDNWFSAWKGKVHACYEIRRMHHEEVYIVAIDGGPACRREQRWLRKLESKQSQY